MTAIAGGSRNAMSVDVEEHFQVQAFAGVVDRAEWDTLPSRVAQNTGRLLDLFGEAGVHATFFTLGCVAERHKPMIRRIVDEGHELASHGWAHIRADSQTPDAFRADIRRTKAVLEDLGGVAISGYRAATFSIGARNRWAFEVLADEGYRYSSSLYPVRHDLYGDLSAPRTPFFPLEGAGRERFLEIPMTTVVRFGRNLPAAGGGYFRLLPYPVSRANMRRVNRTDAQPCMFYFHPWEIDPGQPRQAGLPWRSRVRHYVGLGRMEGRLKRLLRDFAWDRVDRVYRIPDAAASHAAVPLARASA